MKGYRIIFECYDKSTANSISSSTVLMEGGIKKPVNVFNYGFRHEAQIELIRSAQTALLNAQNESLVGNKSCPHCKNSKLAKFGTRDSIYHDVFTDHPLTISRYQCRKCNYEPGSLVKNILGDSLSGDLTRLQAELGATYSFRESEKLFTNFSRSERKINNHDRIKCTVEHVGTQLGILHSTEGQLAAIEPAKELVVNVDGGHIKSTEDGKRSFEAMTAVIYRPEALVANRTDTRNTLSSKHCAASANADGQAQMISSTIVAALKQGLSLSTSITALCDGAENCWQIVNALKPLAASTLCILDWFHLAMKIQNIALPEKFKFKLVRIKWHLWRGKIDNALIRLKILIDEVPEGYQDRLEKLQTYLKNNTDKIINYRERQKQGLVFTSNLAESTVESLINQRCKGQQHMRWSREGLDPILQLRAAIASNDWNKIWKIAVINATVA